MTGWGDSPWGDTKWGNYEPDIITPPFASAPPDSFEQIAAALATQMDRIGGFEGSLFDQIAKVIDPEMLGHEATK